MKKRECLSSIVPTNTSWGSVLKDALEQRLSLIGGGDMLERWFQAMDRPVMKWELNYPITFTVLHEPSWKLRFKAWGYIEPVSDLAVGRVQILAFEATDVPSRWTFRSGGRAAEMMQALYRESGLARSLDLRDVMQINVVWEELRELAKVLSSKASVKVPAAPANVPMAVDIELR